MAERKQKANVKVGGRRPLRGHALSLAPPHPYPRRALPYSPAQQRQRHFARAREITAGGGVWNLRGEVKKSCTVFRAPTTCAIVSQSATISGVSRSGRLGLLGGSPVPPPTRVPLVPPSSRWPRALALALAPAPASCVSSRPPPALPTRSVLRSPHPPPPCPLLPAARTSSLGSPPPLPPPPPPAPG